MPLFLRAAPRFSPSFFFMPPHTRYDAFCFSFFFAAHEEEYRKFSPLMFVCSGRDYHAIGTAVILLRPQQEYCSPMQFASLWDAIAWSSLSSSYSQSPYCIATYAQQQFIVNTAEHAAEDACRRLPATVAVVTPRPLMLNTERGISSSTDWLYPLLFTPA